jgi:hypothetical protein
MNDAIISHVSHTCPINVRACVMTTAGSSQSPSSENWTLRAWSAVWCFVMRSVAESMAQLAFTSDPCSSTSSSRLLCMWIHRFPLITVIWYYVAQHTSTWKMLSSGIWRRCVPFVITNVSEEQIVSIFGAKDSWIPLVRSKELPHNGRGRESFLTRTTRHHIPYDRILHCYRRENVKSHIRILVHTDICCLECVVHILNLLYYILLLYDCRRSHPRTCVHTNQSTYKRTYRQNPNSSVCPGIITRSQNLRSSVNCNIIQ